MARTENVGEQLNPRRGGAPLEGVSHALNQAHCHAVTAWHGDVCFSTYSVPTRLRSRGVAVIEFTRYI